MLKCHYSQKLGLFSKRFVFNTDVPSDGEPSVPVVNASLSQAPAAPDNSKPQIETNFIANDLDSKLPEQADIGAPIANEEYSKLITGIDDQVSAQLAKLDAYAKEPTADQQWIEEQKTAITEAAGTAKIKYAERWATYNVDLEQKRESALKDIVADLENTAILNAGEMTKAIEKGGETFDNFKETHGDWLKQHEEAIMAKVYQIGENLYQNGDLRTINQYDDEVGGSNSKYQEGELFDDVLDDEDNTEQYTQGLATAILAIYGKDAEQKFAAACKKQENEEDGGMFYDGGFNKLDSQQAAAAVLETTDDTDISKMVEQMSSWNGDWEKSGLGNTHETKGFVYASLLVAKKEFPPDLYDKYVGYLQSKFMAPEVTAKKKGVDYRQIMNPITFKDAYIKSTQETSQESPLNGQIEEKNGQFLARIQGEIGLAKGGLQSVSDVISAESKNMGKLETILTGINTSSQRDQIIKTVDIETTKPEIQTLLGEMQKEVNSIISAAIKTQKDTLLATTLSEKSLNGVFDIVGKMKTDANHPGHELLAKNPAAKLIFDNTVQLGSVMSADFAADYNKPDATLAHIEEYKTNLNILTDNLSALSFLENTNKPSVNTSRPRTETPAANTPASETAAPSSGEPATANAPKEDKEADENSKNLSESKDEYRVATNNYKVICKAYRNGMKDLISKYKTDKDLNASEDLSKKSQEKAEYLESVLQNFEGLVLKDGQLVINDDETNIASINDRTADLKLKSQQIIKNLIDHNNEYINDVEAAKKDETVNKLANDPKALEAHLESIEDLNDGLDQLVDKIIDDPTYYLEGKVLAGTKSEMSSRFLDLTKQERRLQTMLQSAQNDTSKDSDWREMAKDEIPDLLKDIKQTKARMKHVSNYITHLENKPPAPEAIKSWADEFNGSTDRQKVTTFEDACKKWYWAVDRGDTAEASKYETFVQYAKDVPLLNMRSASRIDALASRYIEDIKELKERNERKAASTEAVIQVPNDKAQ